MLRVRLGEEDRTRLRRLGEHFEFSDSVIVRKLIMFACDTLESGRQLDLFRSRYTHTLSKGRREPQVSTQVSKIKMAKGKKVSSPGPRSALIKAKP